jgi:histidine triad (HIT) family protein
MKTDTDCVFCKIVAGQMPCFKLLEIRVARAVNQALSPVGLNLIQANGPGAQQSVRHFHVHVLPRKLGDQLKLNWGVKPGDSETIAALAEKIRARL